MQNRKFMVDRKIHGCFRLTNHIPGHSCPQQRLMDERAWDKVKMCPRSRLAADRNVRAPEAVLRCARTRLTWYFRLAFSLSRRHFSGDLPRKLSGLIIDAKPTDRLRTRGKAGQARSLLARGHAGLP